MRIKNWDKYQTKRTDRPNSDMEWLKLHRRAVRGITWNQMNDAERGQFIGLMLIADRDGVIETDDATVLQRMAGMSNPPNLQLFQELGLVELDNQWSTSGQPTVQLEKRRLEKSRVESEKKDSPSRSRRGATLCPDDWSPSQEDIQWASKKGFLQNQIEQATEQMIYWSQGNGKKRTRWGLVWRNWLLRNGNGSKVARSSQENSTAKWDQIREQAKHIDFGIGRETSHDADAKLPPHDKPSARNPDRLIPAIINNPDE